MLSRKTPGKAAPRRGDVRVRAKAATGKASPTGALAFRLSEDGGREMGAGRSRGSGGVPGSLLKRGLDHEPPAANSKRCAVKTAMAHAWE
jgi:hypothetical protein